ncbi:hypothetical protein HYW59_03090 [Candidatus Kaiserbacteria bacterium]|nr:hypothetical protein [Candidatus Kaiserbacteria bacterium]
MKPLLFETYLAAIRNSVGARIFRTYYARVGRKRVDILRSGELSCAFHVSSILAMFKFIRRSHGTVDGTVRALEAAGWKKVRAPRVGAVLVWEEKKFKDGSKHRHIGFYVPKDRAVSNSFKRGHPVLHHWTFKGKRNVEVILWHPKLH